MGYNISIRKSEASGVAVELITSQKKDESFLGKLEIALQFLRGGITSNTYYQVGAGQEQRHAYSFIKVAAGAGVFEWND